MELTKKDVVVVALGRLQRDARAVDTEDVAIAAHALAPQAFGWRKHTEHIDLDMVRTSLRHEAETTDPRIAGSIRTGWFLTAAGQSWYARTEPELASSSVQVAVTPAATGKRRAETREVSSAIDRLRNSTAFKAWAAGKPITDQQAGEAFRIDVYTSPADRHRKTARIHRLVSGDPQLDAFLTVAIPAALNLTAPTPAASKETRR